MPITDHLSSTREGNVFIDSVHGAGKVFPVLVLPGGRTGGRACSVLVLPKAGCQVGGHLKKGGKEDIFSGKGGQKEDIFCLKLIHKRQKQYQIYK